MSAARRPPALALGLALLVAYTGAILATARLGTHPVRALFEGVGPPPAYQWVNPPPAFKNGNIIPRPGTVKLAFTGGKSVAGAFQTPDGQFVIDLASGAVPPHGADPELVAVLTPLDPATLGALPPPLRAAGNACRIELAYSPSKQAVDAVGTPGDLFLTVPEAAEAILFSPDGKDWQRLDTKQVAAGVTLGTQFSRPGFYVAATSSPPPTTAVPAASGTSSWMVVVVVLVVVAAVIVVLGKYVWWRKRRRQ